MSAPLHLPDCRAIPLDASLSDEEKRELVVAIAAGGVGAIDRFLADRGGSDSSLARRIQALRDELLRRAEDLRRRLSGEFAAAREERVAAYEAAQAAIEERRAEAARGLERIRFEGSESLERATFEVPLFQLALEAQSRPAPWWRRAWRAILRALRYLLSLLLAPLRLLLGTKRRGPKGRRAVLSRRGLTIDLAAAGADPRFRRAVRDRMRTRPLRERAREAWKRLLAREDYEETVRRLMEDALTAEESRVETETRRREREMTQRLAGLADEEERRKKALDDALARLEREKAEAEAAVARRAQEEPIAVARAEVLSELEDSGLLRRAGNEWLLTERLVDRFAEIVLAEETRKIAGARGRTTGAWADGEGNWVREPLQSEQDLAHMDLLGSAIRSRTRTPRGRPLHLYEDDVVVYREERGALHHVVIVLDRSGSMEEHGRMEAAKRAVLALHRAVKRDSAANRVDILAMDTHVEHVDLLGVWESQPRGFTNTGHALKRAGDLLRAGRTERGILYLITDGLPEAYTKDGEDIASTPEKCLAYALEQAKRLRAKHNLELAVILLEADDPLHVDAAEAIAREVRGRVFKARPEDLAQKLLKDFDRAGIKTPTPRA